VEYQVWRVPPISNPNYNVGLEPAIAPFLLLGRLEGGWEDVNADFFQASEKQIPLCGQASRRWRIIIKHKYFHFRCLS
jgi:hypothetical protein